MFGVYMGRWKQTFQYEQCTSVVACGTISCKEEDTKSPLRVQGVCEAPRAGFLGGALRDRGRVRYYFLQRGNHQTSVRVEGSGEVKGTHDVVLDAHSS